MIWTYVSNNNAFLLLELVWGIRIVVVIVKSGRSSSANEDNRWFAISIIIYLLLLEKGIRIVIIIIETLNKIIHMYWVILSIVGKPAALLAPAGALAPIGTLGDASVCWSDKVKKIQRDNTMETRMAIICCIFYRGCLMPRNTFPELSQGLGCVGAGGGLTPASS